MSSRRPRSFDCPLTVTPGWGIPRPPLCNLTDCHPAVRAARQAPQKSTQDSPSWRSRAPQAARAAARRRARGMAASGRRRRVRKSAMAAMVVAGENLKITDRGAVDFLTIPAAPRSRKHRTVATDTKTRIQ